MAYKLKPHTAKVTSAIVTRLSYCEANIDTSLAFAEWMCIECDLIAEIQSNTSGWLELLFYMYSYWSEKSSWIEPLFYMHYIQIEMLLTASWVTVGDMDVISNSAKKRLCEAVTEFHVGQLNSRIQPDELKKLLRTRLICIVFSRLPEYKWWTYCLSVWR